MEGRSLGRGGAGPRKIEKWVRQEREREAPDRGGGQGPGRMTGKWVVLGGGKKRVGKVGGSQL